MCTKTDAANYEDWNPLDLTGEQAADIVYSNTYRFKVIEDDITDTSRWDEHHTAIIKDMKTGKFYRTYYDQGLTEMQDNRAFEYDDKVLFEEVIKVPVQSHEWKAIK